MRSATLHQKFVIPCLALLLAGFAVRTALYGYHGLEGDEGFSVALARIPLDELIPGVLALRLDIHPPLYAVALKGWTALAGENLLTVRLLNILAELLTGALLLRLTGRVFGRRAALIAGALWVSAPLLLHAASLARMYALITALVTAGAVCVVEATKPLPPQPPLPHKQGEGEKRALSMKGAYLWILGAGVCALAAMYTHLYGVIAFGVFGAALLLDALRRRDWRRLVITLIVGAAGVVLYLPYALSVLEVYRSGRAVGTAFNLLPFAGVWDVPGTILSVLLTNRLISGGAWGVIVLALFAVGALLVWRPWAWRAMPLQVMFWGSLTGVSALAWTADVYRPRYLAPFAPLALALLAGMAESINTETQRHRGAENSFSRFIMRLGLNKGFKPLVRQESRDLAGRAETRRALSLPTPLMLLALLGVSAAGALADLDRTTRDDFAAAAQFVQAHERPGDAVVVIPDWGQEAFKFHYRDHGAAPVTGLFPRLSPDIDYAPILESVTQGHARVWLVRYQPEVSDADDLAPAWLRERAVTLTEVFPSGMRVQAYDFAPQMRALPDDARPLDARFGDVAALRGVYLPVVRGSARDNRLHPPSAWVQVVLYWETLRAGADFVPRVRLTDGIGQVWGAALERENSLLARHPVSTWQTGQVWQIAYDLNLNPDTPPGVYNIEVMALDAQSGQPMTAAGANAGASWVIAGNYVIE